jgi:hypothetical protein
MKSQMACARALWTRCSSVLVALGIVLGAILNATCSGRDKTEPVGLRQQALGEPAWQPGVTYSIGQRVTYGSDVWECRQTHTSQAGLEPLGNFSLWFRPTPTSLESWRMQTSYIVGSDVLYGGARYE